MPEQQEQRTEEPKEQAAEERIGRREFMRKAARVGGLTALGLMGAETLLPAVLERMARLAEGNRLAGKIAAGLRKHMSVARACGSGHACYAPNLYCWPSVYEYAGNCDDMQHEFACSQSSFSCTLLYKFGCANYWCSTEGAEFTCNTGVGFDCGKLGGDGQFRCYGTDFECTYAFTCRQRVECGPGTAYECTGTTTYTCRTGQQYTGIC